MEENGNTAARPGLRVGVDIGGTFTDAMLVDDPQLVEAVSTTAALAIEKHQLDAELRAKLEELRASRERIVEAASDERRRLERNLHLGIRPDGPGSRWRVYLHLAAPGWSRPVVAHPHGQRNG